jgi:hypothetical protein
MNVKRPGLQIKATVVKSVPVARKLIAPFRPATTYKQKRP